MIAIPMSSRYYGLLFVDKMRSSDGVGKRGHSTVEYSLCLLQELHLLEQFTAARVGHQAAVESMQEAAQGGVKH